MALLIYPTKTFLLDENIFYKRDLGGHKASKKLLDLKKTREGINKPKGSYFSNTDRSIDVNINLSTSKNSFYNLYSEGINGDKINRYPTPNHSGGQIAEDLVIKRKHGHK